MHDLAGKVKESKGSAKRGEYICWQIIESQLLLILSRLSSNVTFFVRLPLISSSRVYYSFPCTPTALSTDFNDSNSTLYFSYLLYTLFPLWNKILKARGNVFFLSTSPALYISKVLKGQQVSQMKGRNCAEFKVVQTQVLFTWSLYYLFCTCYK